MRTSGSPLKSMSVSPPPTSSREADAFHHRTRHGKGRAATGQQINGIMSDPKPCSHLSGVKRSMVTVWHVRSKSQQNCLLAQPNWKHTGKGDPEPAFSLAKPLRYKPPRCRWGKVSKTNRCVKNASCRALWTNVLQNNFHKNYFHLYAYRFVRA